MSELLFMEPVFKEMIWGGSRMRQLFHYPIPSNETGECWAISANPGGDCKIRGGNYDGEYLSDVWDAHPELFGTFPGGTFPLLIKIIDAKRDLSIQVHPDDNYARLYENGALGKTECWYILDCDQNATIVIGHHARNYREMEQMILEKRWEEFIREIPIKKGDFFQIEPGCLHAIKGGTLLLETQQNSDITYRVHDYDRLSGGKMRQLHVRQSMDTIKVPFQEKKIIPVVEKAGYGKRTHFIDCECYSVDKYEVRSQFTIDFPGYFTNVSIVEGEGIVEGDKIEKGSHFIVPHRYGPCHFEGHFSMVCSTPGKRQAKGMEEVR